MRLWTIRVTTKTAIIIGGGIAGCSTAYALAKRGIAVTLLEQHATLASEASGNPVATLYPKLSTKPSAQSMLAQQGFAFTLNLFKQLPDSSDFFNACGQIQLAYDAREQSRQNALVAQYPTLFQALNAQSASDISGIPLKNGGLFLAQAGWVKPKALCNALTCMPNITIVPNALVLDIEKNDVFWRVKYQDKTLQADALVLCHANQVAQFRHCASVESTPVRGQVNFFAPTPISRQIKTIICGTQYLSPAVDGMHSIGATYAPNDLNPALSEADSLASLAALQSISPEIVHEIQSGYMPQFLAQGRVAWRSQTQDYLPLAGQLIDEQLLRAKPPRYNAKPADLPWLNGLYINAGHGSKGMITAPICGELIANMLSATQLNMDENLASKLNPSRFLLKALGLKQLANTLYAPTYP